MIKQGRNHLSQIERNGARVGEQIRDVARQWGESAAQASDDLQKGLENIENEFDDARDAIVSKTKGYVKSTNRYVTKNPWLAVGISMSVGVLVGMMIGNRGGDDRS